MYSRISNLEYLYIVKDFKDKMNKYRITYPNNKEVREYKSRTTNKKLAFIDY